MKEAKWKFVSNYLLVLAQLVNDPARRQRDIAAALGITEGSVQRILGALEDTGYVHTKRVGRRNHYEIDKTAVLRHPLSAHIPVIRLAEMIAGAREAAAVQPRSLPPAQSTTDAQHDARAA